MPVQQVGTRQGKPCFRWGTKGKVYCGRGAEARAARQGRAIKARRKE